MAQITRSFLVPHTDLEGKSFVAGLELFCKGQNLGLARQYVTIDERKGVTGHVFTVRTDKHTAGRKLRKLFARTPARFQYQALDA